MKPTVLIVEDDESVAYMLEIALTDAGFETQTAIDGLDGWGKFQSKRPDIVLSDIRMPRMDGLELLTRIKAADAEMDVVLLTAHGELPTAIQAIELGAYRYLEKPIRQIAGLVQTLKEALEKRQLVRDRQTIDRISQDLGRQLGLSGFLDRFLQHIIVAFPRIRLIFISLYDPKKECLTVLRAHGFSDCDAMVGEETRSTWSVGAQAFKNAKLTKQDVRQLGPGWAAQARSQGMPDLLIEFVQKYPSMGVVGIPIISEDKPIGSLAVANLDSLDQLDDQLINLLKTLCSQVGLYLRNVLLVDDLQAQTERLQAVLDSTMDGMVVITPAGEIITANPRFHTMLSTRTELGSQSQTELINTLCESIKEQRQAFFTFGLDHPSSDEPTILEVHAAQVLQGDLSLGIVANLRDVTLARSLDQKRDDLLQLARHEVGTPLKTIQVYVHNLLNLGDRLAHEQRLEALKNISLQAEEVQKLVEETLSYSQLKEQLLNQELAPLNLSQMAQELAQQAAVLAAQREITFSTQIDPDLMVMGNATLGQAFRNILDNARKFTPAGGSIVWKIHQDGLHIRAEVTDSGIGIHPDELKEIFDPYYRTSTAQDFPGTGLGLSLASDIIAAHRGKIEVRSAPGEGSTFIVTLLTVSTE